MTKLTAARKLIRETATVHRGDPLVIELHPRSVEMKLKGQRWFVTVDYETIFELGQKLASRRLLAEHARGAKSPKGQTR